MKTIEGDIVGWVSNLSKLQTMTAWEFIEGATLSNSAFVEVSIKEVQVKKIEGELRKLEAGERLAPNSQ